jgi:hypothetical protein
MSGDAVSRYPRPLSIFSGGFAMARKAGTTAPKDDLDGQLALMLCEALLHVLVEKRVLTKKTALEAIDTVAELTRERIEREPQPKAPRRRRRGSEAIAIIEAMRASFATKS